MASPRALILQGILGVGGLCASSAGGVGLALGKTFLGGQKDQGSEDDSYIVPETLEITEVVEEEDDLGIPRECDTSCSLTAKQLKRLKFERRGDKVIEIEGLEEGDEFELTIEVTEDETNYPRGKKYTLRPKTIGGTVSIKGIKEGDIVLGKDKEVLIREIRGGGKLEHLLEEVNGLGIPKRCEAEGVKGEPKTCELTKEQLQKLKFEARRGEKISIEGQSEGNVVTLKIEDKSEDLTNYPRGKKYTITSSGGYIAIGGVRVWDIVLGVNEEFVVREKEEGGELELLLDEVDRLGIPKKCGAEGVKGECYLIQKQLSDLRFEAKGGTSILVEGWSDISRFKLTIENKEGDTENYPKGKKYTLEAITGTAKIKNVKGGDIDIWDGKEVVIRETSVGDKFERAPEEVNELGVPKRCTVGKICHLTKEQLEKLKFETGGEAIKVEGLEEGNVVALKIEDKQGDTVNYPNGKKYILRARTGTVTIKNVNEGDIEIGKEVAVIREKPTGDKLEKAPKYEIDNLGIPRRCNADSATVSSIQKCELTKEELEKLNFEPESGSSISIDGLDGDDDKVELTIAGVAGDEGNYHKGKNKKYTLKATAGTATITGAKGGGIVLETNKSVDFRETEAGNKLETYLDVLGIPRGCKAGEVQSGSAPKTCELTQDHLKNLKFKVFEEESGDEVKVDGLNMGEKITLTISGDGEKNKYPDNKKYAFNSTKDKEDIKITKGNQEVKIEKKKVTWFKTEDGQLVLVGAKSETEIKKENKLAEVKKILEKLGFEDLSNLSIEFNDISNPTKHQQTKVVEISNKNESVLKKIQFKDLDGGAESTNPSSLSGFQVIKVYLEWDGNADKYPNNMKFSIENQSFTSFDFKKRGKNTVKISKRTSTSPSPTFKVEQQGDRWYLVRS